MKFKDMYSINISHFLNVERSRIASSSKKSHPKLKINKTRFKSLLLIVNISKFRFGIQNLLTGDLIEYTWISCNFN